MKHELAIMTNDGWVVTLVSDARIHIGEAILESIIVQPVDEYNRTLNNKRVIDTSDVKREIYRLRPNGTRA